MRVTFWSSSDTVSSDADLTWDSGNNRLDVVGNVTAQSFRTSGIDHITPTGASRLTIDQQSTSQSRLVAWGQNAATNGALLFHTARSDFSNAVVEMVMAQGVSVGDVSTQGVGTLNVKTGYYINGTPGITQTIVLCGGTITVVAGIVTSTTC